MRDRQAFDRLYQHTSAKLFGVALRLLKDRAEAEDALQEVYMRVWQRADRYSASRASAMSWLIAVARNHAIDRLRLRRLDLGRIEEAAAVVDGLPTPEAAAIAGAERTKIDDCLKRIDAEKAEAVRGAYIEGYSYQELATRFDIPLNTMRTWLRRSLLKLRECLEE